VEGLATQIWVATHYLQTPDLCNNLLHLAVVEKAL